MVLLRIPSWPQKFWTKFLLLYIHCGLMYLAWLNVKFQNYLFVCIIIFQTWRNIYNVNCFFNAWLFISCQKFVENHLISLDIFVIIFIHFYKKFQFIYLFDFIIKLIMMSLCLTFGWNPIQPLNLEHLHFLVFQRFGFYNLDHHLYFIHYMAGKYSNSNINGKGHLLQCHSPNNFLTY